MKKLTTQQLNDRFESLPKNEQRVVLCKDVIKHLNTLRLKAVPGVYVEGNFTTPGLALKASTNKLRLDIKEFIDDTVFCNVCAKGALFASKVINYNNCYTTEPLGDGRSLWIGNNFIESELLKYFNEDQLHLIENAFEHTNARYANAFPVFYGSKHPLYLAACMYWNITDPNDRLRRIMNNVIRNNGTFVLNATWTKGMIKFAKIQGWCPNE